MSDIEQSIGTTQLGMSEREKRLEEKLGSRLLLIWLLGAVIAVQLLVILHLAK